MFFRVLVKSWYSLGVFFVLEEKKLKEIVHPKMKFLTIVLRLMSFRNL